MFASIRINVKKGKGNYCVKEFINSANIKFNGSAKNTILTAVKFGLEMQVINKNDLIEEINTHEVKQDGRV